MDPTEKMMAVTLMYRSTGYSAEASDWYWVKYLPNGKVDEKDTRKGRICLAAKSAADERHSAADGGDCTFFDDVSRAAETVVPQVGEMTESCVGPGIDLEEFLPKGR